ncbi:MAG TPA: CPBP family intramembrane glutamic endopeptidase [Gemmataceae bacterium]|jgi:membrane protease YdiL (CAAX protease family)
MSQALNIQLEPPAAAPPVRRGRPLLAWLVICAAVAFILWRYSTVTALEKQRYDLVTMRLQGRYLVGAERFLGGKESGREQLYNEAKDTLNRGTYAQRLRFVVLAGELKGPDEAREQLHQFDRRYREVCGEPSAEDAETARLLDHLYAVRAKDPKAAASLPEDQKEELRRQLGWFGDLALAPRGADDSARQAVLAPATRTVWSLLGVGGFMACLGFVGLALLATLSVLYFLNRLRGGLAAGSPHHGVYAETFALYMLLFLGLSVGAHYLFDRLSLREGSLALSGLAALGSLAALGWPVLRGIPWRQVRRDIGWHAGRRPLLELLLGPGCYAMALPMLVLGILLFVILTKLRDLLGFGPEEFGPSNAPGHPIVFWAGRASWWVWLEVLFVAAVVAPVVEETMFRGVLYRHLRSASSGLRPALSVFFSAIVVSFLFAVIHPQGFLAVPMLMALALAFTLMREWRDTLVPPMIAHGINNAVATVLMFLMS